MADRLDTAAREARANSFGQRHNRRGSSRDQARPYSNVSPFVDPWSDAWIRISPEPSKKKSRIFLRTQSRCGSPRSVGVLALNWQRSETYLQQLGRYTVAPIHLPNLDIMNVGIPKSGIPEAKQEIDEQDSTFTAANAGVSMRSFGPYLVAISILTSPRRLNRMIVCKPAFRIHTHSQYVPRPQSL